MWRQTHGAVAAGVLLAAPAMSLAQPGNAELAEAPREAGPREATRRATRITRRSVREGLTSTDSGLLQHAIEGVATLRARDLVTPLAQRIRGGLPPALLDAAIASLDSLGRPETAPILFELAMHRRPAVRRAAVRALSRCGSRQAESGLLKALHDDDPEVREEAARGLSRIGTAAATEDLLRAVERGLAPAAVAAGHALPPDQVGRLLTLVGRLPFDSMGPALMQVLDRRDVPEATKLEVIAAVGELGTPGAKTLLEELLTHDRLAPAIEAAATEASSRIAQ